MADDDITLGELARRIDALAGKVDELHDDVTAMKLDSARMSGRVNGGLGVLVFLGTVAGAIVAWFTHSHLS